MKPLAILAAAILAAGPALAQGAGLRLTDDPERHTIYQRGKWSVEYVTATRANPEYCTASTTNERLAYLSIAVTAEPGVTLFLIDSRYDWPEQTASINVWIDRRASYWSDVDAEGSMVVTSIISAKFLDDIARGVRIYVDYDRDNYADDDFSLVGSMGALSTLVDCKAKLGGLRG